MDKEVGVRFKGLNLIYCDSYAVIKLKRQVRKEIRNTFKGFNLRLIINFFDYLTIKVSITGQHDCQVLGRICIVI